ncbi:MAG TPA: hypothetical protein DCM86_00320 [Verrucomicrobiales bacterium]|nr:hypothetical protein [Verrucomicrobiales bacterium]
MRTSHSRLAAVAAVLTLLLAPATKVGADPVPLSKLAGKWSATGSGRDGKPATRILEISGEKLVFQLLDEDKQLQIYATGKINTEALGSINIFKVSDLRGGQSPDSLDAVDDDRTVVFLLGDGTLTVASGFDKERDEERPRVDVYRFIEAAKQDPAAELLAKLTGKWKLKITFGESESDYGLVIASAEGKPAATLVSPRSGEHKASSVSLANGKLTMEVQRELQGNQVTLLYTAELKGEELTGTVVAKGAEDQYKGTWKGSR